MPCGLAAIGDIGTAVSFEKSRPCRRRDPNYRWWQGLPAGDSKYDNLENRLAAGPAISLPTITLEGDANGAFHADQSAHAGKFSSHYAHHTIRRGIGHNLPQEAPRLANAISTGVSK